MLILNSGVQFSYLVINMYIPIYPFWGLLPAIFVFHVYTVVMTLESGFLEGFPTTLVSDVAPALLEELHENVSRHPKVSALSSLVYVRGRYDHNIDDMCSWFVAWKISRLEKQRQYYSSN